MLALTPPHSERVSLVCEDARSQALLARVTRVARESGPVLLCGETGTGKARIARQIHDLSERRTGAFVTGTCGRRSEVQLERELFGHEGDAFSGAAGKPGWIEAADGGTLFLSGIGDVPLATQAKLLRVLRDGEVVRLGSSRSRRVDVRLIAATDVNLHEAVHAGHFREDLFQRLNGELLTLLPLRDRPEDVLPAARHFLTLYGARLQLEAVPQLGPDAERALAAYAWPGNIRELESAIHHALLVSRDGVIRRDDLGVPGQLPESAKYSGSSSADASPEDLLDAAFAALFERRDANLFERVTERLVAAAHEHSDRNAMQAARLLGISRNELWARLKQVGAPVGR